MGEGLAMQFEGGKNQQIGMAYNSSQAGNQLFSQSECEAVIAWSEKRGNWYSDRLKVDLGEDGHAIRQCSAVELNPAVPNDGIDWLLSRLSHIVSVLNGKIWRFDLTELSFVHVFRYDEGDQVGQHVDLDHTYCERKIALLVQLSKPDGYQGGALEYGIPPSVALRAQGSVLAFPAWVPHRVTPVTSGRRYSVSCFALGPSFQ